MSALDLFQPAPLGTFMGLSATARDSGAPPLACIVGIPFDCGTHPFRIGSREGPEAIRKQSHLLRAYDVEPLGGISNPTAFLRMIDTGNASCSPGNINESYPAIEGAISSVLAAGAIPISMGGDGAGTLPQLRAVSKRYPDLAVLHIDAHTDTYDLAGYNTATTFTRAAEEQLVDVGRSFHLGARGNSFVDGVIPFGRSVGYNVIPFSEFDKAPAACVARVTEALGKRPVYLCFDMDVFDPSCAPGVCTPEWGGFSAKEGFALLNSLSGLNFVAFDVNTVSPAHDVGGSTAFLAAAVLHKCCALAAQAVQLHSPRH